MKPNLQNAKVVQFSAYDQFNPSKTENKKKEKKNFFREDKPHFTKFNFENQKTNGQKVDLSFLKTDRYEQKRDCGLQKK